MTQIWRVIHLSISILFFLPHLSQSLDPYFEACKPRECGGLTIKYPFYIKDQHDSFCGYPGFQVVCRNNRTIINLSNDNYVIQKISPIEQTVTMVNTAFIDTVFNCTPGTHNLTLDGTMFKFGGKHSEVFFLQNCSKEAIGSIVQYREMSCKDFGETRKVIAAYAEDMNLESLAGKCGRVVSVPYEGQDDSEVESVLRNGLVLQWTVSNCSDCFDSGGHCVHNRTSLQTKCFCPDGPSLGTCFYKKKSKGLKIGLGISVGIILLIAVLIAIWHRKKLNFAHSRFVSRSTSLERTSSDLERGNIYFGVPLFSYRELEEATDNFDQSRELGDGGFGTVYYGKLKDGREVAVKRLFEKSYKRVEQFINEVQILTCLRHQNLVSLYGCTSHQCRELLLVYEYVPNGTVADHLYGDKAKSGSLLPWPVRMRIALETASALSYLHATDIIHRDVKTNNILLDSSFSVKVADFGLSRLFPNDVTHVSTAPQGTPGYVDPEYHQCYQLTNKSDVFSFGVVLIELISSLPAVDMHRHRQEINLSTYAMNKIQRCAFEELVDPQLGFVSDFKVRRMTTSVAELAFQCLQHDKEFRPSMDEALEVLKRIESADYEAMKAVEASKKSDGVARGSKPPRSPLENDDAKLLPNRQPNHPSSPNSVMDKWGSRNTTPSSSK